MNSLRKLFFLVSLAIFVIHFGVAQDIDKNIMINPDGDTIIVRPIPDAEITSNVERTYENIKSIEGRIEPSSNLVKFDSIYSNAHHMLDSLSNVLFNKKEYNSIRDIDDASKEWTNYSSELNNWRDIISQRIKTLEKDYFQISVLTKEWELTLENARISGVPSNVLTNVNELYQTLLGLKKKIKTKQNEALRKQNHITELRLIVDEVNTFLQRTRKDIQSDYLRRDSPAIWYSADTSATLSAIKAQISESSSENLRSINLFYETNSNTLIFQLLLFIFLWIAFYFLHKHSININELDDKLNLDNARDVVSKHGLSALVISLFASIWLYSNIPTTINDIIQLSYIIIALLFLPGHIDKRLRIILFALLTLFITNNLQVLFAGKLFSTRLIMFLESFIAGWILYKIIAPNYFIANKLKKNNWEIVLKLIPIFYIFLGISVIGNIFGFVNLALLLNNTTVNALFNLNILILVIMVMKQTIALMLRTPSFQTSNIIHHNYHLIEKRSILIIQIIGVFLWVKSVLILLGIYDDLDDWFTIALSASWEIGNSTIKVDGIINFILVIIGTYLVTKAIKALLKDEIYPRVKLPRGVPGAITMLSGYVLAGYGIYIALGAAGIDLSSFGLAAGALGVGIGFGLQGIVANFIAGLVLAFERPIQVGDTIEIGTMMGDVTQIGVRACTIRTYDGSEVIVPNSSIITNDVVNWTLSDRRKRRDINVAVAYGNDPNVVLGLIKGVAENHPEVLKIPAPWALFDGFGDNSLDFRIRIWTTMDTGMTTKSAVAVAIYAALNEAGIEVPFPQRDLHIRSVDPAIQQFGKTTKNEPRKSKTVTNKPNVKEDPADQK